MGIPIALLDRLEPKGLGIQNGWNRLLAVHDVYRIVRYVRIHMKVALRIPRDRRTPDRACGHVSFVLRWPSGTTSARHWYRKSLTSIIRMFSGELERVPLAERSAATATLNAAVRKAGGGEKWIRLASWSGTEPVNVFYQAARTAWRKLPKEGDDHRRVIVDGDEAA